jgi:Arc-like DNA binding domain
MARKATKKTRKRTDTVKLNLRYPWWMHRSLVGEAVRRHCSLNTEIIARLERSLLSESHDSPLSTITAKALLAGLHEAVLRDLVTLFVKQEAGDEPLGIYSVLRRLQKDSEKEQLK